jgi:SAM-dependent methyltransferase
MPARDAIRRGRSAAGEEVLDPPIPAASVARALATVGWHDAECGAYRADLALWEELADRGAGEVLELGCGTGRVGLHLARRGHRVTGLDCEEELLAALRERAVGLQLEGELGDAREFGLGRDFGVVLAPMQLLQLFAGSKERLECLRCLARHLKPGGIAGLAIVEEAAVGGAGVPLPDAREADGWLYLSLPIQTRDEDGLIVIRRLRQVLSPDGELSEELAEVRLQRLTAGTLEREAVEAGLLPTGRRQIPSTDAHIGSTAVLFKRRS